MPGFTRDGLLIEHSEQPWLDLEPADTLDQLNAASIRYRIAAGGGTGGRTRTLKNLALVRTNSTPKPGAARSRARCATPVYLDSGRNTLEETMCEHTPRVTDPYDQAALQAVAVGLLR